MAQAEGSARFGLSKSRYTQGLQCPKMLWMWRNKPEQFDSSVLRQSILATGNEVGDLAMGYYGPFVEVPFDRENYEGMAELTARLIREGTPVICEATFMDGGNLCMADILRLTGEHDAQGRPVVDVVEVKSSAHVKDVHYDDLAYQVWLIERCGYVVRTASLMHLNSKYVRGEQLDLRGLFTVEDLTPQVRARATGVPAVAKELKDTALLPDEPAWPIGAHCLCPYECGFQGWCWRDMPEPNVFDIARLRKDKAEAFLQAGIRSFADLAASPELSTLSALQRRQVLAEVEGHTAEVNVEAVREFLAGLAWPLSFLDFETFQRAVPVWPGTRPFQQIPSQYSLHIVASDGAPTEHREFLAPSEGDPRRAVAERLVADVPAGGTVLAWNMSFERSVLLELADAFPDLAPRLLALRDAMQDLMAPFRRQDVYLPQCGGSCSIKSVLPALFPDDPSLDYHELSGVHNGYEASDAFLALSHLSPEERARLRESLLRYCELDTLAMVRIWERLRELTA